MNNPTSIGSNIIVMMLNVISFAVEVVFSPYDLYESMQYIAKTSNQLGNKTKVFVQ